MKAENASPTSSAETIAQCEGVWPTARRITGYALLGMVAGLLLLLFIAYFDRRQPEACRLDCMSSQSNITEPVIEEMILTGDTPSFQAAEVDAPEDNSLEESLLYLDRTKEILNGKKQDSEK